uniref:Uncharacterized protein n=1 Tax=Fagus sylvatica TaxID=28930 RepID=A0A2N9IMW1_FAGSY
MTPKSILPAEVGKRKIPAKAILKALIAEFLPPSLGPAMKSLASPTGKSLQEKYFVSRSKEMLAFRQVSFWANDLRTQDCRSQTQILLQDSVRPRTLNGYDKSLAERGCLAEEAQHTPPRWEQDPPPQWKSNKWVGIPERSKSLEQGHDQPASRMREGNLPKIPTMSAWSSSPKKSPPSVSSARHESRESEVSPRSRDRHLWKPWTQKTQKRRKPRNFSEERGRETRKMAAGSKEGSRP